MRRADRRSSRNGPRRRPRPAACVVAGTMLRSPDLVTTPIQGDVLRTIAVAMIFGAAALPLSARGEPPPLEPHAQAAKELLQTIRVEQNMAAGAEAMANVLIQRNPTLGPYKDVILKWAASYMTWDTFGTRLVILYEDAFTERELRDITAFYKTPSGQKALVMLPQLTSKMAELGASVAQEHAAELDTMLRERAAELGKAQTPH